MGKFKWESLKETQEKEIKRATQAELLSDLSRVIGIIITVLMKLVLKQKLTSNETESLVELYEKYSKTLE